MFCPTKRFLESAFSNSRRMAPDFGMDPKQLSAYHADLNGDQRQQIQKNLKSGEIKVVFTTNAFEIGLDVGRLDGVIMAGFPQSMMSAW